MIYIFGSDLFLYAYQKSLKQTFKQAFEYKITLGIFCFELCIHKGYFLLKKLVRNVRIKAFWYTNTFYSDLTFNTLLKDKS